MIYPLASSTWGGREIDAVNGVLRSGRYAMGSEVKDFELRFADHFGSRFAVMVNSGSSANLLAVAAMRYKENPLKPGHEIIVPSVSWGTTYYPLHQYGLRLCFVDVDLDSLNLDPDAVEEAVTSRTRGILAVNLLGAPCDFNRLLRICRNHDLVLLEDNCESMGATYDGKYTGTFGLCGTFSMFFSHHMCTMEGGVVLTDDEEIYQIITSLRAHGRTRELPPNSFLHEKSPDPFYKTFRFILPGYNVRPLEISAAIGLVQLDKLGGFLVARRQNARVFVELFGNLDYVRIQRPMGDSSWLGFSMILEGRLEGRRDEVVRRLTETGVECGPIVAGDFTKNPVIRHFDYQIHGELKNAAKVDRDGFFIGNHHFDISERLSDLKQVLEDCAKAA